MLHEKARMVAGYWGFRALEGVKKTVWWLSGERLDIFRSPMRWTPERSPWDWRTNRLWDCWIWLASVGYLYDEWRRGDIPEHVRIGGVWDSRPHP
jgi:hypothetical protein